MKTIRLIIFLLAAVPFISQAQDKSDSWTLVECLDYALKSNLDVRQAELDQSLEEAYLVQSKHTRIPTLNFDLYQSWSWGRSIDPTTNIFTTTRFSANGFSGSSNLTIFNGMQQVNTVKQNEKSVEASIYDLDRTKNNVSLNVVASYLEVIFTRELLGNAQLQKNNTTAQLERTRKLVESGALPRTNLLDLQAQMASDEVNRITAENNVQQALLRLKQYLQIPASEPFDVIIPEFDVDKYGMINENVEEVYSSAVTRMPEVKSADARVESAVIGEKIARGGYFPILTVGANISTNYSNQRDVEDRAIPTGDSTLIEPVVGYLESDPSQVVRSYPFYRQDFNFVDGYPIGEQWGDNLSYGIGFNLRIPIVNGHRVRTNKQVAKIQKERAEINATQTRNDLRQTIETAYNDASAALKTYEAAVQQVASLEEAFRAAEKRYENHVSNYTEYQVANNNYNVAKSDLARAKFDYIFKLKILDFYLGNPLTLE